jgi:hypothetical protein
VGDQVLKAVYAHLKDHHGITAEDIPYQLDTLMKTLEETFGAAGAKTIGKAIAKRFYKETGLEFSDKPAHSLQDYLKDAELLLLTD